MYTLERHRHSTHGILPIRRSEVQVQLSTDGSLKRSQHEGGCLRSACAMVGARCTASSSAPERYVVAVTPGATFRACMAMVASRATALVHGERRRSSCSS
jgi:hypothetical protein